MATTTTSWEAPAYFHPGATEPRELGSLRTVVYRFMMTVPEDQQRAHFLCPEPVLIDGDARDADTEIGPHDLARLAAILASEQVAPGARPS